VRPDGNVAVQISASGLAQVAVMRPNGQLDSNYGTAGFVDLDGFGDSIKCLLDETGAVICVLTSTAGISVSLRRITPAGAYDTTFGRQSAALTNTNHYVVASPLGATSSRDSYGDIVFCGVAWLGGQLYAVATGSSGGQEIRDAAGNVIRVLPAYRVLIVMRWNGDGSTDTTFGRGWQEAGYDPDHRDWSAIGVLPIAPNSVPNAPPDSFIIYGMAGKAEQVTSTIGTVTNTSTIIRSPQPAIFLVQHPSGI